MSSAPAGLLVLVPDSLQSLVENYWLDWVESCEAKKLHPHTTLRLHQLGKVWACSDFVARNSIRYPSIIFSLLAEGFATPRSLADYKLLVEHVVSASQDEAQLMKALRVLRQQEMVRIAWRDLNDLDSLEVIFQELTDLAVAMVSVTLQALEKQQAEKFGMPVDANGEEQALLVFAMGKMGGGELNFSSDIDLIFSFAEDGETSGPRKTSHYEFYLAVIRKLVKVLDEVTVDGFVYRVDTRLRPFGQSGSMAMSFSGLEQYYQLHGRDWERYAMIKAKIITGHDSDREYLQSMLTPFIYRRYLDFSMIESIREMKSMINAQMKRKGMTNNIKLGCGGIREIEFIGQTFQLIRAGREPELRERSIVKVLGLLAEKKYLTQSKVEGLIAAYWFLRKLENRLQMLSDKQTHTLPDDEQSQLRICVAMRTKDWSALLAQLAVHQQLVDQVFQALIAVDAEAGEPQKHATAFAVYWPDVQNNPEKDSDTYIGLEQYLSELGYQQTAQFIDALNELKRSTAMKNLTGDSERLMAQLLGSLLEEIACQSEQLTLFERVGKILKALAGRKVYISLLNEFPAVRSQMLTLCSASEWFTERLLRYPILLDSLLSTAEGFRQEYDIRQLLDLELKRIETEVAAGDLELLMERMRQFKRQTVFTVAMLDAFYDEAVETVSDRLTDVANVLLERILEFSWQAMVERYGEPQCMIDDEMFLPTMSIVAYGKMGGNELGYCSDLDIIFIHNSLGVKQQTNGEKSLANQQFFARVAQRVIHFLNTRTYSGMLYETDTRLRPNGQAGLMVSSVSAFEQYQLQKAWTWEHQALIRARFVTGSPLIEQEFDRIRGLVLRQSRDKEKLLFDVVKMREKMRQHLAEKSAAFNIKQDAGGLVDIEFMTQAGVLLHAENNADCIRHTATLELINELVKTGWFSDQDASQLSDAYRVFRKMKNWQSLQCDIASVATEDEIKNHRENVIAVWVRLMPEH